MGCQSEWLRDVVSRGAQPEPFGPGFARLGLFVLRHRGLSVRARRDRCTGSGRPALYDSLIVGTEHNTLGVGSLRSHERV